MEPGGEDPRPAAWGEYGIGDEGRAAITSFLVARRAAIIDAGTSWVVRTAIDLQGRRPREETRALVAEVVDLHLAWLVRGELGPRRRFIEFVTTYRASEQFHVSTLLRGFTAFRRGLEGILDECPAPSEERLRLLLMIDACSLDAIYEMSDVYVGKLNDQIRLAREQELRAEAREAQLRLESERNAAEAASAAKSRFLAHISHELRTPLNSVIGFSQYLLADEAVGAAQRSAVANIHASGVALLEMINDVLEVSRIEAGALEARPGLVELGPFLEQIRAILAPHAAPGVRFEVIREGTAPPHFRTDRGKLRQILLNLVGNALKFTERGRVTCRARAPRPGAEGVVWIEFVVEDTGPGIADHEQATMFDPFVQTRAGRASGKGAGLGLSIVRSYAELLGGELRVRSAPGEGTTFTLALPVVVAGPEGSPELPACPVERASAYKILVVDDHQASSDLLRMALERWGFQVEQAGGGLEAVARAGEWRPHLVLMDLRMSDLDGLEATRRIRAAQGSQAPVVVAITASAFEADRASAREAGCAEVVVKPFGIESIVGVLQRHLVSSEEGEARGVVPASAALSEATRERLRRAAIELDLAFFERWLGEARAVDPAALGAVRGWVDEFQFGRVIEWLET